jgi:hypothetical protein
VRVPRAAVTVAAVAVGGYRIGKARASRHSKVPARLLPAALPSLVRIQHASPNGGLTVT